ncbi:MAG: Nif11-like leader peptide family RiPP precursor [Holophagaceae bacterium]|nr:Nif11-like leader peptide family RiPP precursor [Holophagaceae bacterium]
MTNFTPEQLEAARSAKSPEELIEIAKGAGIELTQEQAERFIAQQKQGELADEELENVAGGGCGKPITCRKCNSENVSVRTRNISEYYIESKFTCRDCGYEWKT